MSGLDVPPSTAEDPNVQENVEPDTEADKRKEEEFYEHVVNLCDPSKEAEMDKCDYQFLTDIAICSLTFTVYNELNLGTFFSKSDDDEPVSVEEEQIRAFDTKGRFRLAQIYPLVVRAVLVYYAHVAHSYYTATIATRRFAQVPIGLNDKAYAVVCRSIRRLILELIKKEGPQEPVTQESQEEEKETLERREEVSV